MRPETPRRTGASGMAAWDTGRRGTARSDRVPPCTCPCRQRHVSALPGCRAPVTGLKKLPVRLVPMASVISGSANCDGLRYRVKFSGRGFRDCVTPGYSGHWPGYSGHGVSIFLIWSSGPHNHLNRKSLSPSPSQLTLPLPHEHSLPLTHSLMSPLSPSLALLPP